MRHVPLVAAPALALLLLSSACGVEDGSGLCDAPAPFCGRFGAVLCGESGSRRTDWNVLCAGGRSLGDHGSYTVGSVTAHCDCDFSGENCRETPICSNGRTPICVRNPWVESKAAFVAEYDRDSDGEVGSHEAARCEDCTVECRMGSFLTHTCIGPDGERFANHGYACSSSSDLADYDGIRIEECTEEGTLPRCVRTEGESKPTDLDRPVCMLQPTPPAIEDILCPHTYEMAVDG